MTLAQCSATSSRNRRLSRMPDIRDGSAHELCDRRAGEWNARILLRYRKPSRGAIMHAIAVVGPAAIAVGESWAGPAGRCSQRSWSASMSLARELCSQRSCALRTRIPSDLCGGHVRLDGRSRPSVQAERPAATSRVWSGRRGSFRFARLGQRSDPSTLARSIWDSPRGTACLPRSSLPADSGTTGDFRRQVPSWPGIHWAMERVGAL